MLGSQDAEAIWRQYVDRIEAVARKARGEAAAFGRERARLLDYGGAVHIVAWLDQAESALHVPRWSAALIAEPDGHTDLAALAAESRIWLARAEASAEKPWREMDLVPPRLVGGRLVAVLASPEDRDAAVARALAFAGEPLPHPTVFRLVVEVPTALGLVRDRSSERDFYAALLGPATRRAQLQIGNVGPRLSVDLGIDLGPGDGGVVAGLYPARAGVPDLRWLIPNDTATHYAWRVDFPALWAGWLRARAVAAERDPLDWRKRIAARHGCDLGEDVFAHLSDRAILLWRNAANSTGTSSPLANACLVAPVRDEKALIERVQAVLRQLGQPATVAADGVLRGELTSSSIAIGHGVACMTFAPGGDSHMDAVLTCAAEGRRSRPAADLPAGAPASCNGLGRLDVATLVVRDLAGQLPWLLWLSNRREWMPSVPRVAEEAERWLPLLHSHNLDEATTLGGNDGSTWQLRILW